MPVMVRFRTSSGGYAVPVEATVEVRSAVAIRALPDPADGVVGVLEHDGVAIPVVRALGGDGQQVLVVQPGDEAVGVLVDEVLGVSEVGPLMIGPPPAGQDTTLVSGTVRLSGELMFVLDVAELVGRVCEWREHAR
jgi:chemotaxis signal transduction protein